MSLERAIEDDRELRQRELPSRELQMRLLTLFAPVQGRSRQEIWLEIDALKIEFGIEPLFDWLVMSHFSALQAAWKQGMDNVDAIEMKRGSPLPTPFDIQRSRARLGLL